GPEHRQALPVWLERALSTQLARAVLRRLQPPPLGHSHFRHDQRFLRACDEHLRLSLWAVERPVRLVIQPGQRTATCSQVASNGCDSRRHCVRSFTMVRARAAAELLLSAALW